MAKTKLAKEMRKNLEKNKKNVAALKKSNGKTLQELSKPERDAYDELVGIRLNILAIVDGKTVIQV